MCTGPGSDTTTGIGLRLLPVTLVDWVSFCGDGMIAGMGFLSRPVVMVVIDVEYFIGGWQANRFDIFVKVENDKSNSLSEHG